MQESLTMPLNYGNSQHVSSDKQEKNHLTGSNLCVT